MRHFLQQLIKFGTIGLILTSSVAFWPGVLGGYLAYKAVDAFAGLINVIHNRRMSAKANISDEEKQRLIKVHQENTNKQFFNVRENRWNLRDLPFDFFPSEKISGRETYFTVAGVENVVKGRVLDNRGRKVAFSIEFDSADKAQKMSEYIAEHGLVGTKVMRTEDGKFSIESDNAVDMGYIVKEFYPPRTFRVEREISTTKQYVVTGCKSYEEAVAKFQQNRMAYSPANIYQTIQDTVEGHKAEAVSSPNILNPSTLEVGSFIINETSSEIFSKNITFNGGIDCTDDALRSEASAAYTMESMSRDNDLVEDQSLKEPVLSNGVDDSRLSRYVDIEGKSMPFRTPDDTDVAITGACVVMKFKSREDLMAYVNGDVPTSGMSVFVDTTQAAARDGEFVLTLPLNNELIDSMKTGDEAAERIYARYASSGLTRQDCEYACILDSICSDGYATVRLTDNLDFSQGYVNGVPVSEYRERFQEEKERSRFFEGLSERKQQQWLKEAACIESIHLNLDLKTNELVITSTVASEDERVTKIERKQLTDEQALAMQKRGDISKAEAKDLLMKMHPDYFGTYALKGNKPMFEDPVGAFIRNEQPKAVEPKKNRQAKQQGESNSQMAAASKKNNKKNGMSI